jgi:hypothetical protein
MKFFTYLIIYSAIWMHSLASQEHERYSIQGGRMYFEMASGSQRWSPGAADQWSFRIGGGANAVIGTFYTSGKYSIAGIRHAGREDFPQSLVTALRFGGGWMFQDARARWTLAPMLSAGHTSDRVMPRSGETNLQFDGWGLTPGFETRFVVHNSNRDNATGPGSAPWSAHYIQFELHRILSGRAYTTVAVSYNMIFHGFHLGVVGEFNTLERGARGWMVGLELGASWFNFRRN